MDDPNYITRDKCDSCGRHGVLECEFDPSDCLPQPAMSNEEIDRAVEVLLFEFGWTGTEVR